MGDSGTEFESMVRCSSCVRLVLRKVEGCGEAIVAGRDSIGVSRRLTNLGSMWVREDLDLLSASFMLLLAFIRIYSIRALLLSALLICRYWWRRMGLSFE